MYAPEHWSGSCRTGCLRPCTDNDTDDMQFRTNVDHGQITSLVHRIVCQINPNERLYLIIFVLNL